MNNAEQSAEQLFGEASGLRPEQRSSYLDHVCRDEPELRRRVEALLFERNRQSEVLDGPAPPPADEHTAAAPTHSRLLQAGTKLGRYSILELLGSGGMGMVYRARDESLQRFVAIKILAPGMLRGEEGDNHFRREALALAKLNHPHIAAIYDVGQQDGTDYIVMECVQGEPLATWIRGGPLSARDATWITLQVAEALQEAHEQGIIHRDLKPANVMINSKKQAKVLDFGLAKLLAPSDSDATLSFAATQPLLGTPPYMSPEQVLGGNVDARTDLWSLGVLYYELLTAEKPFRGASSLAVLRAIAEQPPISVRDIRPDLQPETAAITCRAMEKDPDKRYQSASEAAHALSGLLAQMTHTVGSNRTQKRSASRWVFTMTSALVVILAAGVWQYHRLSRRQWASEEAIPGITNLLNAKHSLAAFLLLQRAQQALPSDPRLLEIAAANTSTVSITSKPSGAEVEMQDYLTPDGPWYKLGTTPLQHVTIPSGYFRWRVSSPGLGDLIEAPETEKTMDFALARGKSAPPDMVYSPGGSWEDYIGFLGWVGPYKLPPYYVDRYEVTNREFQRFIKSGGYANRRYWPNQFEQDGRKISWDEAMARFRDTTDRPGPATWSGGHYPDGQADLPVSGVSWFEASAYAAYAAKQLPILAQFFQSAPSSVGNYAVMLSNISRSAPAAVGAYKGVGPYGTYDMAGNVREWIGNPVDGGLRLILGGSWRSPSYLYSSPEALSPFDRSDTNGFRCVRDLGPVPAAASRPIHRLERDFTRYKPVSNDVFRAYELLYAYAKTPLNAKMEGVVRETRDWKEEKVSFEAAYNGERMAAYLFLPKIVKPPYQTVLFFPSARVLFLPDNSRELGDIKFFDYILQSGRAVIYPVYDDTYERRLKENMPGGGQNVDLTSNWYKDAARSLDYLATRSDIDSSRLAYLGVSMGAADGVIISTLLQDRLRTAILLDGGFFLEKPPAGGDQADFAPRMKKPVLMVNGRYDFTFPVKTSQDPLFLMLGTPEAEKRHIILETPHDVTERRSQLVKIVLEWLDQYLGRVNG